MNKPRQNHTLTARNSTDYLREWGVSWFMDTDNKRTYYLWGGCEESDTGTGGGACTEPCITCEDCGPCCSCSDDSPKGGAGCCITCHCQAVAAWKEYHHQRLDLFTIVDMNAPVWQIPYAMGPHLTTDALAMATAKGAKTFENNIETG